MGGHCIAVDPWFIVSQTPDEARLIRTAREVNDGKPQWVIDKVKLAVAEYLQANPTMTASEVSIASFGLAFKPDIDDLRESPAVGITLALAEQFAAKILAVEPNIDRLPQKILEAGVQLVSQEAALASANVVVLLVDHRPFRSAKPTFAAEQYVIDTKGIWG